MTLREIERIRRELKTGSATTRDFYSATDEAIKFHHKVSELQEMLLIIKKKCQQELQDLEDGKPATVMHVGLLLDFILDVIDESQHIRAA